MRMRANVSCMFFAWSCVYTSKCETLRQLGICDDDDDDDDMMMMTIMTHRWSESQLFSIMIIIIYHAARYNAIQDSPDLFNIYTYNNYITWEKKQSRNNIEIYISFTHANILRQMRVKKSTRFSFRFILFGFVFATCFSIGFECCRLA